MGIEMEESCMKMIRIGNVLDAPAIALGCMRISSLEQNEASFLVKTALDLGISFFDHADIYGDGEAERVFANCVRDGRISRDEIIVQTKCSINKKERTFDFSKEYIVSALEQSLKRLEMDYVDVLLLHRPDTLMEPDEVAEAFSSLQNSGKVRQFGVSNQNPAQIRLLSKYLNQKIIANQLQFSPVHTGMIDAGININMRNPKSIDRDGGVLEFCRLEDITIQAWSPFRDENGVFLGSDKYSELNRVIDELALSKNVAPEAIVTAWILRHPAKMQVIPGTTNKDRLKEIARATNIEISREEWYRVYCAAGNVLP